MHRVLIITDSASNPRSFPESSIVHLEETYPYLLRKEFNDSTFWQLSYGNLTTEQLLSQAISYLTHWNPDYIIVQSGMADCRPEAFTELQKNIVSGMSGPLFRYLRKHLYNPKLIKYRQKYRVTERRFRKTLKKFKSIFSDSTILWLGIASGPNYESVRPGVNNRMRNFNAIIEEVYGEHMIPMQLYLDEIDGFNDDGMHWNVEGHKLVSDLILKIINSTKSIDF